MTLRSRLNAIERAARRRQERGYGAVVTPKLTVDMDDPETRAVFEEMASAFGDRLRPRGGPAQRDAAQLAFVRELMSQPQHRELAAKVRRMIEKALAKSPVHYPGASRHER